uniref:ATP synthase F0 subunit 8 n=1 Tax=Melipona scutellaris TaxID=263364 RepID=A0A0B4U3F9_9HYME|nr:ATP synthase F0 subunit 8 [Melipona scutellaris]AJC00746.1 ATP synthase F0 subunit 8 [Melipona scutellaris]
MMPIYWLIIFFLCLIMYFFILFMLNSFFMIFNFKTKKKNNYMKNMNYKFKWI